MRYDELEEWSTAVARWSTSYFESLRERPVRSPVKPGEIASRIEASPPESADSIQAIFDDFQSLIPPGMTHWQHPRFFAYFPSNAAPASMIAEQLINTMAAQCMLWQTSPAATELETVMIDWLRQSLGLPEGLSGVIQDSATSATLSAVLTMRERALHWRSSAEGLSGSPRLRIYASDQNHSSVDKAIRIAGIGEENLVKIPTDGNWSMRPDALLESIASDRSSGFIPAGVIGCIGGTSIGAADCLREILGIARRENLPSHVDAAWAGSAMICPELRDFWDGIELADSIVINPHKWLGASFDCTVQFMRTPDDQIRTLATRPHYLQSVSLKDAEANVAEPINYSEWTIPLGRRFRALKLWFLFRAYGLEGLRKRIRDHVRWAGEAARLIAELPYFELTTRPRLALFTFRFVPPDQDPNHATRLLLQQINDDGRTYLTQTNHQGQLVIRFSIGQFDTTWSDVEFAVRVIEELSVRIMEGA